jgi:hypothetical protein
LRTFGALLLSLTGAILSFFSVLILMDPDWRASFRGEQKSRLAAFAAPALLRTEPEDPHILRPLPAIIARQDTAPATSSRPDGSSFDADTSRGEPRAVVSARVPPVARRAPPVLPDFEPGVPLDEAPAVAAPATGIATSSPAAADGAAAAEATTTAASAIDTSSRSALGGPPASSIRRIVRRAPSSATPKPVKAKPLASAPVRKRVVPASRAKSSNLVERLAVPPGARPVPSP